MDSLCAAMEFNMAACFSSFSRCSRACLASRSATAFAMISSSLLICCCFCTANFCIIVSLCLWSSLKQKEMQTQAQCWDKESSEENYSFSPGFPQFTHTLNFHDFFLTKNVVKMCTSICMSGYSLLNLLVYDTIYIYDICISVPIKTLYRPTEAGLVALQANFTWYKKM